MKPGPSHGSVPTLASGTAAAALNSPRRGGAGVIATFANLALTALGPLALVPLYLRFLGPTLYGVWVVVVGATPFLGLAGLGLTVSAGNRLAEDFSLGRGQALKIIATSFYGYVIIAAAGACVAVPTIWWVASSPHTELARLGGGAALLFCLLFFASLPARVYQCTIRSAGRVDLEQWTSALVYVLRVAAIAAVLVAGLKLRALATVQGLAFGIPGILCFFLCRRKLALPAPAPADFSWSQLRPMIRPGFYFLVLQLGSTVAFGVDSWVIAGALGASAVAPYAVAYQAVTFIDVIWWMGIGAMGPWVTARFALRETPALRRALLAATKAGILYAGCWALFLGRAGRFLVHVWAGRAGFPDPATWTMLIMYLCLQVVLSPSDVLLTATSTHVGYARLVLVEALLNLCLSIWWVRLWGLPGVIAGTLVARAVTNLWFMPLASFRAVGLTVRAAARSLAPAAAAASVAAAAGLLAWHLFGPAPGWRQLLAAALAASTFAAIYLSIGVGPGGVRAALRTARDAAPLGRA